MSGPTKAERGRSVRLPRMTTRRWMIVVAVCGGSDRGPSGGSERRKDFCVVTNAVAPVFLTLAVLCVVLARTYWADDVHYDLTIVYISSWLPFHTSVLDAV